MGSVCPSVEDERSALFSFDEMDVRNELSSQRANAAVLQPELRRGT